MTQLSRDRVGNATRKVESAEGARSSPIRRSAESRQDPSKSIPVERLWGYVGNGLRSTERHWARAGAERGNLMAENDRCSSCGQELPGKLPHGQAATDLLPPRIESGSASSPDRDDSEATATSDGQTPAGARPVAEGPGSRIGLYRLLQEIGEGGMGVVYMAEQEKPVRRRIALKIIKPGMDI